MILVMMEFSVVKMINLYLFPNVDFTSGLSEKLNEISKTEEKLKRGDGAKIISKECDPFCGICNENIQAFPLDRIKEHYKQQHNTEGYIKCCNKKLTTDADIEQHSLMHLGFDHFMFVLSFLCIVFVTLVLTNLF